MGGALARVGDLVSCGDHLATGSSDVFVNGMPVAHMGAKATTGHGCWPPTELVSGWSKTVTVNGQPCAIVNQTRIRPHTCGKNTHDGIIVSGSPDVTAEKE